MVADRYDSKELGVGPLFMYARARGDRSWVPISRYFLFLSLPFFFRDSSKYPPGSASSLFHVLTSVRSACVRSVRYLNSALPITWLLAELFLWRRDRIVRYGFAIPISNSKLLVGATSRTARR